MPSLSFSSCFKEPHYSAQKLNFVLAILSQLRAAKAPSLCPGRVHILVLVTDFLMQVQVMLHEAPMKMLAWSMEKLSCSNYIPVAVLL